MRHWQTLSVIIFCATAAQAQLPVMQSEQKQVLDQVISGKLKADALDCRVQVNQPFLDFAFRFEAGYIVRCGLSQFNGKDMGLNAFLRIQPQSGNAVYLGDSFRLPVMPDSLRAEYKWRRLHQEAEFSGVFSAGPGHYAVELAIVDSANRVYRKGWKVKIEPNRSEQKADLTMEDNTADSAVLPPWRNSKPISESRRGGPQITVLLDAAPLFPASQKLRAWDRAFLMSSLHSLLRGIQPSAVRLVVFNLEQQRELYRSETFSHEQFPELGKALRRIELGSIDYKSLQAQEGWASLLAGLINNEAHGEPSPDAIVFLGPNLRKMDKLPKELLTGCDSLQSRVSYLEYFPIRGYEFPDSIHYATSACHGNVYKLHSPADLAEAISKLQARMPQPRRSMESAGTF